MSRSHNAAHYHYQRCQVADYWYTVVAMNDYQKQRFVERVIGGMFNTVAGKVRSVSSMTSLVWALEGDHWEMQAITMCQWPVDRWPFVCSLCHVCSGLKVSGCL